MMYWLSKSMHESLDAAAVGFWENEYTGRKHARLQIITLAELFQNKGPDIPWVDTSVAKKRSVKTGPIKGRCCNQIFAIEGDSWCRLCSYEGSFLHVSTVV